MLVVFDYIKIYVKQERYTYQTCITGELPGVNYVGLTLPGDNT